MNYSAGRFFVDQVMYSNSSHRLKSGRWVRLLGVRCRLKNNWLELDEDRFSDLDREVIQYSRPGHRVQLDRVYFLHWHSSTLPIRHPVNLLVIAVAAFTS